MRLVGAASTTVVGLAAAWWVYARLGARADLESLLQDSAGVFAARVYVQSLPKGRVAEKDKWLLTSAGLRDKAQALVRITNRVSAEDAFAAVKADLPPIPTQVAEQLLPGLLGRGLDAVAGQIGIAVPASVRSELQGVVQTPQGQNAEGLASSAQGLWSAFGAKP